MNQYLEAAREAAAKAGAIQMESLNRSFQINFKGRSNLVTEVDIKCEKVILDLISSRFPGHDFLAEEGGESGGGSDYLWIVDPLDGTTNYAHGYKRFCVSIALAVKGEVKVGLVRDEAAGETFHAIRGEGAFLNDERIRVSKTGKVEDSLVCTGFSYHKGEMLERTLQPYLKVLPEAQSLRRDGSAALDLCYVAAGRFDGFWEIGLNAWDVAAGTLILEEAGGKWTGLSGASTDIYSKKMLATNGLIHDEMVSIMEEE